MSALHGQGFLFSSTPESLEPLTVSAWLVVGAQSVFMQEMNKIVSSSARGVNSIGGNPRGGCVSCLAHGKCAGSTAAAACVRLAVWTPDRLFRKLSFPRWTNLLAALGLGELGAQVGG